MTTLSDLVAAQRLTEVVDIGANPVDGDPPYAAMLAAGLCRVTGFEPQADALQSLLDRQGPHERYLPYAIGDGGEHVLHCCRESGMTSLLEPDPVRLAMFAAFGFAGEVIERIPVVTRRLDDVEEITAMDLLKIDIQGGELGVFQHGTATLAGAVAVQTEVSFVPLYREQPGFGDVDAELRAQGFMPHCIVPNNLMPVKLWPIAPCVVNNHPDWALNQLLEADFVYIRDIAHPGRLSDDQLTHLALIAHHCYGSYDLASRCLLLLEERGSLERDTHRRYLEGLGPVVSYANGWGRMEVDLSVWPPAP